jgi:hypothetical protein
MPDARQAFELFDQPFQRRYRIRHVRSLLN